MYTEYIVYIVSLLYAPELHPKRRLSTDCYSVSMAIPWALVERSRTVIMDMYSKVRVYPCLSKCRQLPHKLSPPDLLNRFWALG